MITVTLNVKAKWALLKVDGLELLGKCISKLKREKFGTQFCLQFIILGKRKVQKKLQLV